jgi:hypothetical protein
MATPLLLLILHAWLLSAAAVVFATVLVADGMVLAPVQAWVRAWHRKPRRPIAYLKNPGWPEYWPEFVRGQGAAVSKEIDERWWWKPLWGCSLCVAGQWAFWGYPLSCINWHPLAFTGYHPLHHLYFTSLTILFAAVWRAVYAWTTKH